MSKHIVQFYYHGGNSGGSRVFSRPTDRSAFIQLNRSKWASYGLFEEVEDGKVSPVKLARDKATKEPDGLSCPHCSGPAGHLGNLGSLSHYRCQDCGGEFSTHNKPAEEKPVKNEGGIGSALGKVAGGVLGGMAAGPVGAVAGSLAGGKLGEKLSD